MISEYFARDYAGGAFVLFGRDHLISLTILGLICLAIYLFRDRWNEPSKKPPAGFAGFDLSV